MKFLARESRYFFAAAVLGLLLMPMLLWGIDWLLGMNAPGESGRLLSGYRRFYLALDQVATWSWTLSPYALFLLMRLLFRRMHPGDSTDIGRAAAMGKVAEVESLFEAGADINGTNASGQTPLHLAAANGNDEMVGVLLEDGAELDLQEAKEGLSALHLAAQAGNGAIVELLVRYGADLEASTKRQQTPLHLAALHGHAGVVSLLLKYHVRLDSQDADGMTAQQLAEKSAHHNVVELITDYAGNSWAYLQISNG